MLWKFLYSVMTLALAFPMMFFAVVSDDGWVWVGALVCYIAYGNMLRILFEYPWQTNDLSPFWWASIEGAVVIYAVTLVYLLLVKPFLEIQSALT